MAMKFLLSLCLLAASMASLAAPKADLWAHWQAHDETNPDTLDHSPWSAFLSAHLRTDQDPHRLAYGAVPAADRSALAAYVRDLQQIKPQRYARAEQMAYWINLYNASTVLLVLDHYPVKSITKIKSGFFSFGPWDKKLLEIDARSLSLNDIEHRILRPIFGDARVHYAVNCASIGCPNLAPVAYTAANLETLLEQGARAYVNHPRGVDARSSGLVVSSIYDWFQDDFGGTQAGVLEHLRHYAQGELKAQLGRVKTISAYRYDWALNDLR